MKTIRRPARSAGRAAAHVATAALALALYACGAEAPGTAQPLTAQSTAALDIHPNYAQGRPTAQSSTGWGSDSSRAVDGNTDGNWQDGSVTHTGYEANPWWQV